MKNSNHVFTKGGDGGYTRLYDGTSVDKDNIFIDTNGNFDELTSYIGLVKAGLDDAIIIEQIEKIQNRLIALMGIIAGLEDREAGLAEELYLLEKWIVEYEGRYPKQKKFILPGKTGLSAQIDVARTICRRAERGLVKSYRERPLDKDYLKYVNRLSDYLYVLARYQEFNQVIMEKVKDVLGSISSKVRVSEKGINLEQAKELIERVQGRAKEIGLNVVIAVVNKGGNPIAVNVMDDAYIASYDIALNKAFTSVSLKMSTHELSKLAQPNGPLYGIQDTNNGRIVIFGGGTLLLHDGEIIGGLGVSGGSAEEDTMLADYGASVI
ncbi:cob(I)yrinic acid a,c-diamide adenosyltransferase [Vallitalea guaymasensis]|uniref:cob(I)yrinic acid a,c-diamide adenosyltransferase n=1 Tax=Vallitalea guaymasensis TaxID=1185412 RepID=UPI000DE2B79E|nr:cob(I)yrinic acid a,c-diamide adenosyltransferase [Vallitalea guaymasensis]